MKEQCKGKKRTLRARAHVGHCQSFSIGRGTWDVPGTDSSKVLTGMQRRLVSFCPLHSAKPLK